MYQYHWLVDVSRCREVILELWNLLLTKSRVRHRWRTNQWPTAWMTKTQTAQSAHAGVLTWKPATDLLLCFCLFYPVDFFLCICRCRHIGWRYITVIHWYQELGTFLLFDFVFDITWITLKICESAQVWSVNYHPFCGVAVFFIDFCCRSCY